MPKVIQHKDARARVIVWFDRPRDELCFASRLDERIKEGMLIPEECIVRIPLKDGEDFIEAVINAALTDTAAGADFVKVMDGVQRLLDERAAVALSLAERVRLEMEKRSGGTMSRLHNEVLVRLEMLERLRGLRDRVKEQLDFLHAEKTDFKDALQMIADFFTEHRCDEP